MYVMRPETAFRLTVALIVALAIANAVALEWRLYWLIPWVDVPMHFFGGLWIGLFSVWFFWYSGVLSSWFVRFAPLTVALGSSIVIGLLWEGFEFSIGITYAPLTLHLGDTLLDLVMDVAGGVAAWGIMRRVQEQGIENVQRST